jgi:hypothetical protein
MRVRMLIGFLVLCAAGVAQTALPPAPLPVTGEPYTAERATTSYQKLADGTAIEHKSIVSLARDSQGRTWTKAKLQGDPLRPETMERYSISIYDPNTRSSTSWCTCNKFATAKHFGDPLPRRAERDPGMEGMDVYLGPSSSIRLKYHVEELPPQVIMGVTTRGSRAVRTVPTGVDGNDHDLTTTIQSWYSPELRLALMTIIDDPVKGLTKLEFENLKRVEPDPAIFRVPAGLMLREDSAALR